MAKKSKEAPHLRVRIPPALLDRLEASRKKSGNTLTGEIVDRLLESFRREDTQAIVETTANAVMDRVVTLLHPDQKGKQS